MSIVNIVFLVLLCSEIIHQLDIALCECLCGVKLARKQHDNIRLLFEDLIGDLLEYTSKNDYLK